MTRFIAKETLGALQRFRRAALRLTPFLLLGGCGYTTSVTWTAPPPRPLVPRSPASVEVFVGSTPARPYVGIGIIEVHEASGSYAPKSRQLLQQLKRAAGKEGCDAITLAGFVNKGVGADVLINDFATDRQGATAICLVYTDGPVAGPSDARVVGASPH